MILFAWLKISGDNDNADNQKQINDRSSFTFVFLRDFIDSFPKRDIFGLQRLLMVDSSYSIKKQKEV